MTRPESPLGIDHLRMPKEEADPLTSLHCLLLNTLQSPTQLPTPTTENLAGHKRYMSERTFDGNSGKVREVGLQDHPNLDYIVVGVGYSREDYDWAGIGYHLHGQAYIKHTHEEAVSEDPDVSDSDYYDREYETEVTLEWYVKRAG